MRTVQSQVKVNVGNQQKVITKTTTYLKVGDVIGAAKTAYDLAKVLRRRASNIRQTLKQYKVDYINSLLNPLLALITGMDIYKKIMAVIDTATPIAKMIARATTIFPHAGNSADIASIVLGMVTKIIVQIATIFLLKMKDMIWSFEFKIREISNEYVIEQISLATRDTVEKCSNIVLDAIGISTTGASTSSGSASSIDFSLIKPGVVIAPDGTMLWYSNINEGIKYLEDGEWHQTNFTDGSFKPCKKPWNGVMFAFSYEGDSIDSKQYGVIYSLNSGKHWEYLNPDDKDYYVYDAALFDSNINFSQYTDVLMKDGIKHSKRMYRAIDVIEEKATPPEVYITDGDFSNYYLYEDGFMVEADRYTILLDNGLMIKPQRIISCSLSYENDTFSVGAFEDEKTTDGELVETLMNHDIKYYGDTSCIKTDSVLFYDNDIEIENDISSDCYMISSVNLFDDTYIGSDAYFGEFEVREYINGAWHLKNG